MMDEHFPPSALPISNANQAPQLPHHQQKRPPHQFSGPPPHLHQLPPLSGGPSQFNPLYGSAGSTPQTPLTPQTPVTTAPSANATPIPSIAPHPPNQLRPLQPSPFLHSAPPYSSSQPALVPTTTQGYTQPIAPAPLSHGLQDLRPMPQGGLGLPTQYGQQPQLYSQPPLLSNQQPEPEPIHVVGQQGRRGVLPTVPGRPAPGPGKALATPTKNADNKFECPHCNKTYLHLKHLKRHMLRHTGERPYSCHLCKDTFSRSDILKRHFQKCSIRRGNPTGANHLAHNQKNKNRMSTGSINEHNFLGSLNTSAAYTDGSYSNTLSGLQTVNSEQPSYAESLPPMSTRTSRSNSTIQPASTTENRRSLTMLDHMRSDLDMNGGSDIRTLTSMPANFGQGLPAFSVPSVTSSSQMTQNAGYTAAVSASGDLFTQMLKAEDVNTSMYDRASMPQLDGAQNGQDSDLWGTSFPSQGQDGLIGIASSMGSGLPPIKAEADMPSHTFQTHSDLAHNGMLAALYSNPSVYNGAQSFDSWDMGSRDLATPDPLNAKVNSLLSFCFPGGLISSAHTRAYDQLKAILTVDNIRHFLDEFRNFQGHWPMIHIPTFNCIEANDGLLLTMICVGAVYSSKMSFPLVRWLTEFVKEAIHRSSRILLLAQQGPQAAAEPTGFRSSEVEELQALFLLQMLLTWHGDHNQRKAARDEFWKLSTIARRLGMLRPVGRSHPDFSLLHEHGQSNPQEWSNWSWKPWIAQETRSRVMYLIFLLDAAMVMFFNNQPHFDISEIRLPLPADDAAWEARNAADCMNALGLNGPGPAQTKNVTGTRRPKQIEMREAVKFLLHGSHEFKPGTTNVYSKFILIHALHVQIYITQRMNSSGNNLAGFAGFSSSGASTPLSQHDWVASDGSNGTVSTVNSGAATPTDAIMGQHNQAQQIVKLRGAVEKWKRAWDVDMNLQYPPAYADRRIGFCRDGIHFYHLACQFISSSRPVDWNLAPDDHFRRIMSIMGSIRKHVALDQTSRGLEKGSVTEIDPNYGVQDLTLDMSLLFAPISHHNEGRNTNISTNFPGTGF